MALMSVIFESATSWDIYAEKNNLSDLRILAMVVTSNGEDPPQASPVMQRKSPIKTTGCTDCLRDVAVSHDAQLSGNLFDFEPWKEKSLPTRCGLNSSPVRFLWGSRTTNVDVMSVSNTTRPAVTIPR